MYHTILVPLDGSTLAESALPFAQALAKATGARLLLVQAVTPGNGGAPISGEERAKAMSDAEAYLAGLFPGPSEDPHVVTAAYFDDAAETIMDESHLRRSDLIVMATHGRSALARTIYGSVAERVFQQVDVPVLFVPPDSEFTWSRSGRRKILVPLDGSELAEEALVPASDMAAALDAELLLLRVAGPLGYVRVEGYPDLPAGQLVEVDHRNEAESYLEAIATDLRGDGATVTTRVELGDPAPTIVSVAEDEDADVIAMATHGRTGLARLLMGSVATRTIETAKKPVLLVRPSSLGRISSGEGLAVAER